MTLGPDTVTARHHTDPHAPRRVTKQSGRWYNVNGVDYPSVTNFMGVIDKSGALMHWATNLEREHVLNTAAKFYRNGIAMPPLDEDAFRESLRGELGGFAHRNTSKAAMGIGNEAHDAIEQWVADKLDQPVASPIDVDAMSQEAQLAYESFLAWAKDADLRPIAAEVVVYSDTNQYAGTADLIALVNGESTLLDWKTSKRVYVTHLMQCVAYQVAWQEMGNRPLSGAYVVRLPKDLNAASWDVEVVTVPSVEEMWPGVEASLNLWRFLHEWDHR